MRRFIDRNKNKALKMKMKMNKNKNKNKNKTTKQFEQFDLVPVPTFANGRHV